MKSCFRSLTVLALLAAITSAQGGLRKRVLVIGIDGVRPDALVAASTPNIDGLIAAGASSMSAHTQPPTVSGPGWSSLLTGVWSNKHGVVNNSFSGSNYGQYPHLLTRIRQICSQSWLGSLVHWTPIATQIVTDADLNVGNLSDAQVAAQAAQLMASGDPDVLFLHFDDTDGAGHGFGFSPGVSQYIAAIQQVDVHVGTVISAMQARPSFANENWLVIVTSDHGGLGTSHGGASSQERTIPLIVSGPSTAAGTTITPAPDIVDAMPTILTFLGIPVDPTWSLDGQAVGLSGVPTTPPSFFPCATCNIGFQAAADQLAGQVSLSWAGMPAPDATGLELRRNGELVTTLPPSATSFVDSPAAAGAAAHLVLDYELRPIGGPLAMACEPLRDRVLISTGDVRLFDDFDTYAGDAAVQAAGWQIVDVNNPVEASTWTITNPGGRAHPARFDGRPSTGGFMISDSDQGGSGSLMNPTGSGMSHDLVTPSFDCSGLARVHLHFDCGAVLNNNGQAVFDVDVSIDGGGTWTNLLRRVAPSRTTFAPVVTTSNAGGLFGSVHVDLSSIAADQPAVRVRLRHFEPSWDWWIAIDNVLVDDVDPTAGGAVELLAPEDFTNGIPGTWQLQGLNTGANTWTTSDPCLRSITAAGAAFPYQGGRGSCRLGNDFAILDSDCNPDPSEDEYLVTPAVDCSNLAEVYLHFSSEIVISGGAVEEVLVSLDGGASFLPDPIFTHDAGALSISEEPAFDLRVLSVPQAAGQSAVAFAFHYQSPGNQWWWAIDRVRITGNPVRARVLTLGSGCGPGPQAPTLAATAPVLGATMLLSGAFGPPFSFGTLVVSSVPPQPLQLPGCSVFVDVATIGSWIEVPVNTDPAGAWLLGITLPADVSLAGTEVAAQGVYFPLAAPPGFALTNGLELRLGY